MYTMLFIVLAALWCFLACVAVAICRLAAFSDDRHAVELAEWVAGGGWRRWEERRAGAKAERLIDGPGEARSATG